MGSRGVPFLDLQPMQEEVRAEVEAGWRELIARSAFVGGAAVSDFERDFAGYCGVPHCVGVASGTDTLRIALTGVLPAYRRRGIARALKLRLHAWARSTGVREIHTTVTSANPAMLALNDALGYAIVGSVGGYELRL